MQNTRLKDICLILKLNEIKIIRQKIYSRRAEESNEREKKQQQQRKQMRSSVFDSCQSVSHLTLLVLAIINICYYCCSINLSLSESNGPNHSGNRRGYREFDFFKTNNEEKIKI